MTHEVLKKRGKKKGEKKGKKKGEMPSALGAKKDPQTRHDLSTYRTRQVYNLFQDLWNEFLGFIPKVLVKKVFKKCLKSYRRLSFIRCGAFAAAKPVSKPLDTCYVKFGPIYRGNYPRAPFLHFRGKF